MNRTRVPSKQGTYIASSLLPHELYNRLLILVVVSNGVETTILAQRGYWNVLLVGKERERYWIARIAFLICQCEYNDLNEACRFCSDRSLQCGTKLSAKGARAHELSQQLLSLQREAGLVPFSDVSKLSSIAEALERRFPTASVGQIYAMAKPTVESAIAVAAEHARNDRTSPSLKSSLIPAASILFGQPLLGDTTPNSIRAQTPAARHAPAQPDVPFRTPSTHPSQPPPRSITIPQTQLQPQQVQFRPRRQTEQTSSYDIDSWFNTFPPANLQTPQPLPSTSTDFFSSQVHPPILISIWLFSPKFNNPFHPKITHNHSTPDFSHGHDLYGPLTITGWL